MNPIGWLALLSYGFNHSLTLAVSLIWCAHIAFDRLVGFGLKSPESFQATHLGLLGKPGAAPNPSV